MRVSIKATPLTELLSFPLSSAEFDGIQYLESGELPEQRLTEFSEKLHYDMLVI